MDIIKLPPIRYPDMQVVPGLFWGYANRVTGRYYGPLGGSYSGNTITIVANKLYAVPFLVLKTETFNTIAIYVSTGAAGNGRLGIYADTGGLAPGALVLDAGAIDTTATGAKAITINQTLTPGLYWLAGVFDATPAINTCAFQVDLLGIGNATGLGGNGNTFTYYTDQAYGELPLTHPTPVAGTGGLVTFVLKRA